MAELQEKLTGIPYLQCSSTRRVFRRRIPEDVRALFGGKTERVITLKARDPEDLEALVLQHKRAFDREVCAARRTLTAQKGREINEDEIPALGERYQVAVLGTDEELRDRGLSEAEQDELDAMLKQLLAFRRQAAACGDYGSVQDIVEAVITAEQVREPREPHLPRALAKTLLHADIRALEAHCLE